MHNLLHHKIEGQGKPIVFLHGFLESSTMWEYLNLIDLNIKKIYVDLPGHGKSSGSLPEFPTISCMAEKVNEILLTVPDREIIVVGHSMGGYVALELAKMNNSISKVILLNSNFWQDNHQKQRDRDRVIEIVKSAKDKFIQEAIPNLFSTPENHQLQINQIIQEAKTFTVDGIVFATKAMRDRNDHTLWVKDNYQKVYVVQGELDKTAPLELMLEKLPKKVGFSLIQNAGHMTHIESTEKIVEILKSFS